MSELYIFSTDIRQLFNHISWKSIQWEPSFSMRFDGLTNRQPNTTKLTGTFLSSANAPKNLLFLCKAGTVLNTGVTVSMMIQVCWHMTVSTGTVASQYWPCPKEQLSGIARADFMKPSVPLGFFFFWVGGWCLGELLLRLYSLERVGLLPEYFGSSQRLVGISRFRSSTLLLVFYFCFFFTHFLGLVKGIGINPWINEQNME